MTPPFRLSMLTEVDVRQAAERVIALSRQQLDRVVGYDTARPNSAEGDENPYVTLFVWLFRYARGDLSEEASVTRQLDVADAVLANPLYAGPEGAIESPLLVLVASGARARLKLRRGETLSEDEQALLED